MPKRGRSASKGRKVFKRKFSRKFVRKSKSFNANDLVTKLSFPNSKITRQPVPDRYLTWLTIENQGRFATGAGSAAGAFNVALNNLNTPLNPGTGVALPNQIQNPATWNPIGFKDLIYNTSLGFGLYTQFRVWSSQVELTVQVQNPTDNCNLVVCPCAVALQITNPEAASAYPQSTLKSAAYGGSGTSNTLITPVVSCPGLAGVPKTLYPAFASAIGQFGVAPGLPYYWAILYRTSNAAVLTNDLTYRIVVRYHVEFMNRADINLTT